MAHVCVIGAGPGGYVAAIKLAQLGQQVTIIERENVGGVCLNHGCIPSKALIHAAEVFEEAERGKQYGVITGAISVDAAGLRKWKERVVTRLTGGVRHLLTGNDITIVEGAARFVSATEVEVEAGGGTQRIRADQFVIATGSRSIELPGFAFDGSHVLSSRHLLAMERLPEHLLIIGGGYIGIELAQMLLRFGRKVTIVELLGTILPGCDPELAALVAKQLKRQGAKVFTGAKGTGWQPNGDGVTLTVDVGGESRELDGDQILVCVGRTPLTGDLGLEDIGVRRDNRGHIMVDAQRRSSVPTIYAIGDVTGMPYLAHKASKEGIIAAEAICGGSAHYEGARLIPWVVFSDPELAGVGLSEEACRAEGIEVSVGRFPLSASGRAVTMNRNQGLFKVVAAKSDGRLLGASLAGPHVSDMIGELTLAMEMGTTVEDLALTVHPHPTLSESLMEAALDAYGMPLHFAKGGH